MPVSIAAMDVGYRDVAGSESRGVRLRQAVLVARDLEPSYERLRDALGLGEPFRDPGVGAFGLHNVVCALGEDFLEIVSPTQEGTAAGRHLERRGEGGYMLIFQLDDLAGARERAQALEVRTVWSIDLDDISASHLHPGDLGGTIVSIDRPLPPESWRWGAPTGSAAPVRGRRGGLAGVTVRVPDPDAVAARWAEVLGLEAEGTTLHLDRDQHVAFEPGDEGLSRSRWSCPAERADPLAFGAARVVSAYGAGDRLEARAALDLLDPGLGRAAPHLDLRLEPARVVESARLEPEQLGESRAQREDRRPARRAEVALGLAAARLGRRLHHGERFAPHLQRVGGDADDDRERRTRLVLALGAVAHGRGDRLRVARIGDAAAPAMTVEFAHAAILCVPACPPSC